MNPASFNSFMALLETISADVMATDDTRIAIMNSLSETVNNLFDHLNDLQ